MVFPATWGHGILRWGWIFLCLIGAECSLLYWHLKSCFLPPLWGSRARAQEIHQIPFSACPWPQRLFSFWDPASFIFSMGSGIYKIEVRLWLCTTPAFCPAKNTPEAMEPKNNYNSRILGRKLWRQKYFQWITQACQLHGAVCREPISYKEWASWKGKLQISMRTSVSS